MVAADCLPTLLMVCVGVESSVGEQTKNILVVFLKELNSLLFFLVWSHNFGHDLMQVHCYCSR
jgi:hypothetical protein